MRFQIYARARETQPIDAAKAFEAGMTMLQQSHYEARRLISGVRAPILDGSGVMAAIDHLVHEPAFDQGPRVSFRFAPEQLPRERSGLEGIPVRARLLGGKCRIESKPGEETSVIMELPVVEREPEE